MRVDAGRSGAMRRGLLLVVCAIVVAFAAVPSAVAATAGFSYFPVGGVFAPAGTGPGQVQTPERVATEPGSGDVIVADTGNSRIDVFGGWGSANPGTSLTSFAAGSAPFGVATDPVNGDLYVSETTTNRIVRFRSDGAATPTYTADGAFTSPGLGSGAGQIGSFASPLAVDPVTHDLLVADTGNHRVSRFTAAGSFVSSFDGSDTVGGAFTGPDDIAVGPTGAIYVVDGASRLEGFSSSGASTGAIAAGTAPNVVATNPTNGTLYVVGDAGLGTTPTLHVIAPDGTSLADVAYPTDADAGAGLGGDDDVPTGIALDASGRMLWGPVTPLPGGSGSDNVQATLVFVTPGVDIDPASQITSQRVHLSGSVDPGGVPTTAWFEYSDDGGTTWTHTPDQHFSAGNEPVSADIDTDADRTYTAHLVVEQDGSGNPIYSSDITFTTPAGPPRAVTEGSTDVHTASAVVYGLINPFGSATSYSFEYGPTTSYGSTVPAGSAALAGAGRTDQIFQKTITGLAAGVTYHYRVTATSANGTTNGADQTFTTAAAEPLRGYEQVTPVDKQDALVDQIAGFQARPDGGGLIWKTTNTAGGSDTPSSVRWPRFLSLRGSDSWTLDKNVDVPVAANAGNLVDLSTIAVSADLTHSLAVSNRKLTAGAVDGGGNLYLQDTRTGALTLVASSSDPAAYYAFAGTGSGNKFMDGAPDFSWFVFTSPNPLTPDAQPGIENAYRWTNSGGLQLISRMPDGSPSTESTERRPSTSVVVRSVSAAGDRALLSYTGDGVYLWQAGQPARAISVSHRPGDPATPQPGHVIGISRDGQQAVFMVTSSVPLTTDAPSEPADIYRLDLSSDTLTFLATLTAPSVQGDIQQVYGMSDDGQRVYVQQGPAVLALLPSGTRTVANIPDTAGDVPRDASPNGRYLAFATAAQLTSLPTGGLSQIYVYDSSTDSLSCASCSQGGSTPSGSGNLPIAELTLSNRYPSAVTDAGDVFFDTRTRLVSADVNSNSDVYDFRDGAAHLISPGDGPYNAIFADASTDGSSVFFTTTEPIVGQDQDQAIDVYVSRVGGGFASQDPPPTRAACSGDDCAEAGTGPVMSSPAPTQNSAAGRQVVPVLSKARISSVRTKVTSEAIHVTVRVSSRGRIRVSGHYVRTTIVNAGGAGAYTLVVPLGQKARSAVRHHRRLKAALRVSYTPPFGKAAVSKLTRSLGK